MRVRLPLVPVPVGVGLRHRAVVRVLVMLVVDVLVFVLERFVRVPVLVMFGEMEPHACRHQRAADQQRGGHGLVQQRNGDQRTHERSVEK